MKSNFYRNPRRIEKKDDALSRLQEIRKRKEKLSEMKKDVFFKTGNEYFFKMNSTTQNSNKQLIKKENLTKDALQKEYVYIKNEIRRCNNLIKKHLHIPLGDHIFFSEKSESENMIQFDKSMEIINPYKEYVKKLENRKSVIIDKINLINQMKNKKIK